MLVNNKRLVIKTSACLLLLYSLSSFGASVCDPAKNSNCTGSLKAAPEAPILSVGQEKGVDYIVYPSLPVGDNDVKKSDRYIVEVTQLGVRQVSYVNMSANNRTVKQAGHDPQKNPLGEVLDLKNSSIFKTSSNHWTAFSYGSQVNVSITVLGRSSLDSNQVVIRPLSKNIQATVRGNTVSFNLDETDYGQYYVEIRGEEQHPVFIFADAPEQDVPSFTESNVYTPKQIIDSPSILDKDKQQTIYFGPGIHTISSPVLNSNGTLNIEGTKAGGFPALPSNTTVYISGGAYIKGLFSIHNPNERNPVENVHFSGRGVISGRHYPHQDSAWANHLIDFKGYSGASNIGVNGLTLVDGPKTCITARAGPAVIDNIKCLGWHSNTDGIAIGKNGQIRNSFMKVFDDVIKLFASNVSVDDIVIWHQQSGAAFQLSWNNRANVSGGRVNNIDVIKVDREIGKHVQTGGSAKDYLPKIRENGKINNAFINLRNLKGTVLNNGSASISVSDHLFENIRFEQRPFQLMQIQIKDARDNFDTGVGNISGIALKNVSMPEEPRTLSYVLDNGVGYIRNITFDNITTNGVKITSPNRVFFVEGDNVSNVILK